jgi:hypothetical protein
MQEVCRSHLLASQILILIAIDGFADARYDVDDPAADDHYFNAQVPALRQPVSRTPFCSARADRPKL